MTKEEKDLLLKDLCARLPYGVKFKWCDNFHTDDYYTLIGINEGLITGRDVNQDDCLFFWGKDKIKPYLRPMSSMTEEEVKNFYDVECMDAKVGYIKPTWNWHFTINGIDWFLEHHFDYRGLIDKGLAIEVTENNNPY